MWKALLSKGKKDLDFWVASYIGGFHLYLFPFNFPFKYIAFTISLKYFDMLCYLKWETYSGPISFEVQWNDIWTDNIQSFEMPF